MKKKSIDEKLLVESKRFRQLCEYSFIGMTEEEDETPNDAESDQMGGDDLDSEVSSVEDQLGISGDEGESEPNDTTSDDEIDTGVDDGDGMDQDLPDDSEMEQEPEVEEEAIEIDITDLVQKSDNVERKMNDLMMRMNHMMTSLNKMNSISAKIEKLDQEVKATNVDMKKRMPTPTEKIEMRSMDSYPYNIKLSDYWSEDKHQPVDHKKTYTVDKNEVNRFSDHEIKNSFYDYEEEDI